MVLARTLKGQGPGGDRGQGRAGTARRSRRARKPTTRSRSSRSSSCRTRRNRRLRRRRLPSRAAEKVDYCSSCRRRRTSSATWSPRARRGARRWPRSAASTSGSSHSTPTSRTRPSATSSRRRIPDRFFEDFIAEQVMVGAAMGFAARGAVPFPSTFACFLTRAATSSACPASRSSTSSWRAPTPASRSARTARRRWRSRICR